MSPAENVVRARLRWLREDPHGYSPQPYDQLADALRRAGHEGDARKVAIAKHWRRAPYLGFFGQLWSWVFGLTVSFGYRLWHAGLWLLVLVVVGQMFVFGEMSRDATQPFHPAAATNGLTAAKTLPAEFNPWIYTLDLLVPVISLGQRASWNAHGSAQTWVVFFTVCGWLLTAVLVAGIVVRRQ